MPSRYSPKALLPLLALVMTSCSTLQVPVEPPRYPADSLLKANKEELGLAVKPLEGVQTYWDYFEDDLPEIGIVAIWAVVRNEGDQSVDLAHAQWSIQIGPRKFERLDIPQVLNRYYKNRHIRIYSEHADSTARLRLERISLPRSELRPSKEVAGFIFFHIDPAQSQRWTQGASLRLRAGREQGKKIELLLPLSYARP